MIGQRVTPVILCGGIGARLWPRSRASAPKPFLPLLGRRTLFQEALDRCRESGFGDPVVVTGSAHLDLVEKQLTGAPAAQIIVEPEPRQTAAAIALAALRLPPDRVMLVCPSDHYIGDPAAFKDAALAATRLAEEGWLTCLAIPATEPATRFGYIRAGDPIGAAGFRIAEFVEKPAADLARAFASSGDYAWNAGIFALRAGDYLSELGQCCPDIAAATRDSVARGRETDRHFYPEPEMFGAVHAESVDRAVMECTDRAAVVLADLEWSDIGDWRALRQMRDRDGNGNSVRGAADLIGCRDVLVDSDGPKIYAVGLENIVIVVDGNDILVANADKVANIGAIERSGD